MRIVNILKDFFKFFFKIKTKKIANYHKRASDFEKKKYQITEKKFISKIIKKYKAYKVLDFGCNNCSFKIYLDKNINYWGIDTNKNLLKNVKLYSNKFKLIKKNIPFKNNYFDCVLMSHVFAHLDEPNIWLERLSKKLKNNGIIIIITPNKFYKFFYFFLNLFNNYEPDLTIYKHYSYKEIVNKFLLNNWKILKSFSYSVKKNKITNSILNSRCIIIAKKINK